MIELTRDNKKIRFLLPFRYESKIIESILTKEEIESLIEQRKDARKNKNYLEADRIRNGFKDKGISLYDKEDGRTIWDTESWIGESLFRLDFKTDRLVSESNPDWGWMSVSYMLDIYSNPRKVTKTNGYITNLWIESYSNLEMMFNNFHLANSFVLYTKDEKVDLINKWSDEVSTMFCY